MPVYYLETSALVKRYRTERGSQAIGELFSEKTEDEGFVTSRFTTLEMESVAARALKAKLLTPQAHEVMLRLFAEDLEDRIIVLPASTTLILDAVQVTRQHALRAGDPIHLAAALNVQSSTSDRIIFVTSDVDLRQAGEAAGFSTLSPETEEASEFLERLRR